MLLFMYEECFCFKPMLESRPVTHLPIDCQAVRDAACFTRYGFITLMMFSI